MNKRRVVITGMGAVTPLGLNVSDTWEGIRQGKSGVAPVESFDVTDYPSRISASVKGFDPLQYFTVKEVRKIDTFIQYGIVASIEAFQDANLKVTADNEKRIGVAIGSGVGGLPMIEKSHSMLQTVGPRKISPFFVPGIIINMVSGNVSIRFGLKGPNTAMVTACATGTHNVGYAARTIMFGDADVMLAGGAEMATCPMGLSGFAAVRALSRRNDDPERASRPWDKDRDGFVLGDGAGVLVLEEYEHAKNRGAHIYAELTGFGMSGDAYHITSPSAEGAVDAMLNAVRDAGLNPDQIDYINAHSTATKMGDVTEVQAIKEAFKEHAYKLCVSSTKSMIGHLLGAAGAVEAIFCILALRDQIAPPTINLDNPDEGCDLDFVPHKAKSMKITNALSNSFGFGGTNASLIFSLTT